MRSARRPLLALVVILLVAGPAVGAASPEAASEAALAVLRDLRAGDAAAVVERFDETMAASLPPTQLVVVWEGLAAQAGAIVEVGQPSASVAGDHATAVVPIDFERAAMNLVVTVDADGRVAGLFVRPRPATATEDPAPPEDPAVEPTGEPPLEPTGESPLEPAGESPLEPAGEAPPTSGSDPIAVADAVLEALKEGDAAAIAARFDPLMAERLPTERLAVLLRQVEREAGAIRSAGEPTRQPLGGQTLVTRTLEHERARVALVVGVDASGRVTGLSLRPAEPPGASLARVEPPPEASFFERELSVGEGAGALPATLAVPEGDGPFPAVVLVHGSGPHDRDQTIGPNAPFRDLAWGLAGRGVAVLRYEKRTRAYPEAMAALGSRITVRHETIDDAVRAVTTLRRQPEVDPDRIVLVGHSLGALVGPRIARRVPLAGLVLLAAPTRDLGSLVVDQMRTIFAADGELSEAERGRIARIQDQAALARSPELTPDTPASELPLGLPASYWLDLRAHDPVAIVGELSIPVLVCQGGQDYQVTDRDFAEWQRRARGWDHVALRHYPRLNHLFMEGVGPPGPRQYEVVGAVSPRLIEDVAELVRDRARPPRAGPSVRVR